MEGWLSTSDFSTCEKREAVMEQIILILLELGKNYFYVRKTNEWNIGPGFDESVSSIYEMRHCLGFP